MKKTIVGLQAVTVREATEMAAVTESTDWARRTAYDWRDYLRQLDQELSRWLGDAS